MSAVTASTLNDLMQMSRIDFGWVDKCMHPKPCRKKIVRKKVIDYFCPEFNLLYKQIVMWL